jgi:hypothetical protein
MTWNILCIVVKQTLLHCEHENEVPICVVFEKSISILVMIHLNKSGTQEIL